MVDGIILDTSVLGRLGVLIGSPVAILLGGAVNLLISGLDLAQLGVIQPLISIFELYWRFNAVVATGKVSVHMGVNVLAQIVQGLVDVPVLLIGRVNHVS
jgi:hypothetical protein